MTLDQVPAGAQVFVDSNIFVYHFQPHPVFGPTCHRLLERVERQDIEGFTSATPLSEVAHRLMVVEAGTLPGWGSGKVLNRLKKQPAVVQQLTLFQTAVTAVIQSNIRVLAVSGTLVPAAAVLSRQQGLLTNDALILALMRQHGFTYLASHDSDFDVVAGLTRYWPA